MAELDKKEVIKQVVELRKEYAEHTRTLEFHMGPAKRDNNPVGSLWRFLEAMKSRQDLIDKRLQYIEKLVLSSSS